ncbi:MAG: TolC family protein [Bacteroidota bacterium]
MKSLFLIIILFLSFNLMKAQELRLPADLKKYVELSFRNYPKVSEMNDLVNLNEVKVGLGKAAYYPTAMGDLSYRWQYPTPYIPFSTGSGQTNEVNIQPTNNYNASIYLAQPLIDLRINSQLNKNKSDLDISKDNLESFKNTIAYQVAQIYYSIIFLNNSLYVQQQQITLLQSTLQQINVKVKNGDALSYDLVSTEVKYTNVENIFTELKAQRDKQYNILGMLTGISGKDYVSDTSFNSSVFNLMTDSVLEIAYRNNPDIRIAGDKIKWASWDIITAERSRLPVLNLQAGLSYKNGNMPSIDELNFNYFVGLGVTLPILPASRPAFQRKMAVINHHASQMALETQKAVLNKDLLNAKDDIKKNQKKLASADTLIMQAQLALKLADERYKFGVITNLELLTAVSNYKDAQLSQLQFEYNLLLSRMDLCRLVGISWW